MDAKVSILTKQYDENGRLDTIKLDTIANFYSKNNDMYLVYKEDEEGLKTTTTIKISDEEVSIKRFGNTNSNMVLKKGKSYVTKYRTPQGLFMIETNTKKLNIDKTVENKLRIDIDYDINVMNFFTGKNKIEITVQM